MEQRIQYAITADGVSIAFASLGNGFPLVHTTPVGGAAFKVTQHPLAMQYLYEKLAERRQFIRYDIRGTGLSDREVPELTLDGLVKDMLAVMEKLGLPISEKQRGFFLPKA